MNRPFIAVFPQTITDGDKIVVRGLLKENAEVYSVNFVEGSDEYPDNVAYHFKTIIPENLIAENTKTDGEWNEEHSQPWNTFNGNKFGLEFAFTDGVIYTYEADDDIGRNLITYFPGYLNTNLDIHSVQIWGDVAKIYELRFLSGARMKKRSADIFKLTTDKYIL